MAKEIYDNDIDKYVDWGGDESTGWLPVSGRAVQKFIKDTLESKIGYIFEDPEHNRCLGFADEDNYNIYIEDPAEHQDLIIQSWYTYFPPVPETLDYPAYYGASLYEILPELAPVEIKTLQSSQSMTVSCTTEHPYVYVALSDQYDIDKILTDNNENITDEFISTGVFSLDSITYNLYEFHLSSGLSLDVNINIIFSKN